MKQKPNIKAIFFDIGGVVVARKCGMSAVLSRAFKIPLAKLDPLYAAQIERVHLGLEDTQKFTMKLLKQCGINCHLSRRDIRYLWRDLHKKDTYVDVPVFRLADSLRRAGYIVGVISDTMRDHASVHRRRGVFKHFKPIIFSHCVHLCKPGGRIFRYALAKTRVQANESLFIDDLPENIAGARKVGRFAIQFRNVRQLKRDLKKLGVS